ncbi:MAG: hypothetical protein V4440_14550 [Pseudomonadota bacterium]
MISPPPAKSPIISKLGAIFSQLGVRESEQIDANWLEFFSAVFIGIKYTQTSGTTAQRPTTGLFPGRFYFDISLGVRGKPIWIAKDGQTWIDATGAIA